MRTKTNPTGLEVQGLARRVGLAALAEETGIDPTVLCRTLQSAATHHVAAVMTALGYRRPEEGAVLVDREYLRGLETMARKYLDGKETRRYSRRWRLGRAA